jgi:hypothetical protein
VRGVPAVTRRLYHRGAGGAREGSLCFFEKKKQKTFVSWCSRSKETPSTASRIKSLLASFSSEKEDSSFSNV